MSAHVTNIVQHLHCYSNITSRLNATSNCHEAHSKIMDYTPVLNVFHEFPFIVPKALATVR